MQSQSIRLNVIRATEIRSGQHFFYEQPRLYKHALTGFTMSEVAKKLIDRLGEGDIFKPMDLVRVGIFGSFGGCKRALDGGDLPHLRIGPRRVLIAKSDVEKYIRGCERNEQNGWDTIVS